MCLKIQDGGRSPSWKHDKLLYFSNHLADFDEILQFGAHYLPDLNGCSKIQISKKNPRPPFWKTLNAIYPLVFDWFWWNLVRWCILALPTRIATKNVKFSKSETRRPQSWKSENRDISKAVWPILAKVCMLMHIGHPDHNNCSKIEIFKNQDGGRPPF